MKLKFILAFTLAAFFLLALATAVMAQDVPEPYAGLKNPFPWSDDTAQQAGKELYQKSCSGCHGADGGGIAAFDFGAADFPKSLEERADYNFWILSEGRMEKGMPPYKSSLSEEQRWQVLTYLWYLGSASIPAANSAPVQPPVEAKGKLLLSLPDKAQSGKPLTLTALLQDKQGTPVTSAPVKFSIKVDFFAEGLMEIGEVLTDDKGAAVLEYTPGLTGDIQIVASYAGNDLGSVKTDAMLSLAENGETFYQTEAGIPLPAPGDEVFICPRSAHELGTESKAPTSALRLPGGILSWLLLAVAAVTLVWLTYFRVLYQVFRIPIVSEIRDTDTRLVPLVGLAIVLAVGIFLALMVITGPYSHLHLLD